MLPPPVLSTANDLTEFVSMSASEDKRFSMTGLENSLSGRPCNFQPPPPPLPSPFDKLPPETIGEILSFSLEEVWLPPSPVRPQNFQLFSLNCPPQSQSQTAEVRIPFQIVLCLVCKKWLDITMAHHSLWATFQIDPIANLHPRFSSQLRQYLQRSGAHSLRIQVRDGSSDRVISDVLDAMMVHSERWDSIDFDFPMKYHFLQQLDVIKDRLPLLQRLHIRGTLDPYPTGTVQCATFHDAPSLNDISLEEIDTDAVRILNLPWNKVSNARLDFTTRRSLLPSLQTLTTLTMHRGGNHSCALSPSGLMFPVTLEKLQVLHVLSHSSGIGHLTCPSLGELEVYDEDGSTILKFLDNSSCSLTRLELRNIRSKCRSSDSIPQILQHKSLAGLTFLQLANHELSDQTLDALILDSGRRLPALETLILDLEFNRFQRNHDFESRVEGLRKIIHSRTYPTHVSKPFLENQPRPVFRDTAGPSLREFFFNFAVDPQIWEAWQDEEIECLRTFCMSRNVLALMRKYGIRYHYADQYDHGFCDEDDEDDTCDDSDNDDIYDSGY